MPHIYTGNCAAIVLAIALPSALCVRVDDDARPAAMAVSSQINIAVGKLKEAEVAMEEAGKSESMNEQVSGSTTLAAHDSNRAQEKADDRVEVSAMDLKIKKDRYELAQARLKVASTVLDFENAVARAEARPTAQSSRVTEPKVNSLRADPVVGEQQKQQKQQQQQPQQQQSGVAPTEPDMKVHKEQHPLYKYIEEFGIWKYDRDGSDDLDMQETRKFLRDLNPMYPIAKSDADVEAMLTKYDEDGSRTLSKAEVLKVVQDNPLVIPKQGVPAEECSGWSPSSGEQKDKGGSCAHWGWQTNWCFIPSDYTGPGSMSKKESTTIPGKFFADCVVAEAAEQASLIEPPQQERRDSGGYSAMLQTATAPVQAQAPRLDASDDGAPKESKTEEARRKVAVAVQEMEMAKAQTKNKEDGFEALKKASQNLMAAERDMDNEAPGPVS
jgi:hypothetical protein